MKKKVLLTGSTGFLGNLFINNFSKKYKILSVGNQEKYITNDIFQYNIDTLNKNLIDDEFSVLHLATYYSKKTEDEGKIRNANIDFGIKILNLIKNQNVKKFIYTNTMFYFDKKNKHHFYTNSKNEFSKILFETLDNKLLSEIYLENTFHYRDTRKKIVPIIVESIKKNMPNPVLNKEEYFNLTYAADVMEVLDKELSVKTLSPKSRVTSKKDINIYSIYEFLLKYYNSNSLNKDLLKCTDSRYIKNIDIPELNTHYFETDIYKNLLKMLDWARKQFEKKYINSKFWFC